MEDLQKRLRNKRNELGLTQAQVAEKAQINTSTYSSYESGKVPPLDIAYRIAIVLGVSVDWLCGDENPSQFNSYGSVARAIIAAYTALTRDESTKVRLYIDKQRNKGQFDLPIDTLTFETSAENLIHFFEKMTQYRKMSLDNKEASEMYEAWLKGELQKLDNEDIVYNLVYRRE